MSTTPSVSPPSGAAPLKLLPLYALCVVLVWGLVIGAMMTWHHDQQLYGGVQAELVGCVQSEQVNCDIVNTSEWSELGGVPIGTWSMIAYGTVMGLVIGALRGVRGAHTLAVAAGVIGSVSALFLAYISKVELNYWCLYCIQHYFVNFLILGLTLAAGRPDTTAPLPTGPVLGLAVALGLTGVLGERVYRQSLSDGAPTVALEERVEKLVRDPEGPAPALSFTVATEEDGKMETFTLDPDDAWKGNRDAKVSVVEFGDLECGYCKRMSSEISKLYGAYGDRVLFVFKHFPMNPGCNANVQNRKHPNACRAAVASVCAQQQGQFWSFHDLAFKNQHQLGDEYLATYAKTVGVDPVKYDQCVRDPKSVAQVRADADVGGKLHIHGTPRIFINGKLYRSGTSAEAMARAIEAALGEAGPSKAASLRDTAADVAPVPSDVPAMQTISAGSTFKIDTFEAAIVDGKAVSGKHNIPSIRTSWLDAKSACDAAGKRMCTESEWVAACQGAAAIDDNGNGELADDMIEGTAYPYGDFHDKTRCWDGRDAEGAGTAPDGTPWRPVYTGEMPGCVTPTGVYDLTGNVEEWVGETPDKAVLLGGAYDTSEDHARCYRRNDTFGAGYANPRTGFRCCSN